MSESSAHANKQTNNTFFHEPEAIPDSFYSVYLNSGFMALNRSGDKEMLKPNAAEAMPVASSSFRKSAPLIDAIIQTSRSEKKHSKLEVFNALATSGSTLNPALGPVKDEIHVRK